MLDIDVSGTMAEFLGPTLKVGGYGVREQWDPKDAGEVEWIPASGRMAIVDGTPSATLGKKAGDHGPPLDGGEECSDTSTISPRGQKEMGRGSDSSAPSTAAVPVPSTPFLSI